MNDKDELKVERIEKGFAPEEKTYEPPPPPEEKSWKLAMLSLFKKINDKFFSKSAPSFDEEPLYQDLIKIKKILEALSQKDLSEEKNFLHYFSLIWIQFIKHRDSANKENANKVETFIKEVFNYPRNAEFSLGYYLSEFAGHKWTPLPYIEILKKLHFDYADKKENSTLEKWIRMLNQLLNKSS